MSLDHMPRTVPKNPPAFVGTMKGLGPVIGLKEYTIGTPLDMGRVPKRPWDDPVIKPGDTVTIRKYPGIDSSIMDAGPYMTVTTGTAVPDCTIQISGDGKRWISSDAITGGSINASQLGPSMVQVISSTIPPMDKDKMLETLRREYPGFVKSDEEIKREQREHNEAFNKAMDAHKNSSANGITASQMALAEKAVNAKLDAMCTDITQPVLDELSRNLAEKIDAICLGSAKSNTPIAVGEVHKKEVRVAISKADAKARLEREFKQYADAVAQAHGLVIEAVSTRTDMMSFGTQFTIRWSCPMLPGCEDLITNMVVSDLDKHSVADEAEVMKHMLRNMVNMAREEFDEKLASKATVDTEEEDDLEPAEWE
jgi:hypothetical protein